MRIIGVIIIIFSSLAISRSFAAKIDVSVRSATGVRTLLERTKAMIECYSLSASEILRRVERSALIDCGYQAINPPKSFLELSEGACIGDAETRELLSAFAKDFGRGYRADELSRCSLYLERMRAREQKLIKESAKKKRVIFTVAICSSLAAIILVI